MANVIRERLHPDVLGALVILGLVALMFIGVSGKTGGSWIYPRAVAGVLLVMGLLLLVRAILTSERVQIWISRSVARDVLLYMAAIGLYLFFIPRIGFWVPTLVMAFLSMTLLGERRDRKALLVNAVAALLLVVAIYFVFGEAFNVRLPAGDWVRLAP